MLAYFAIPIYVISLSFEIWWSHRQQSQSYEKKDTVASLSLGLGSVAIGLMFAFIELGVLEFFYQFALFDDLPTNTWWFFVLLFFGEDFCYYWFHRLGHEMRWMWASHVNHHSSTKYNLGTALRQSWTAVLTMPFFWWPLALLGVPPEWILLQKSISLIYQFFIHTEHVRTLGPLEWVLNTPSHHRVHHASDLKYLDANYGGILIIWDRLFGTFVKEEEQPTYGLIHDIESYNLITIAFHEWAEMWRDITRPGIGPISRLRYVFGPPGWSHDGSKLTVTQMRAQATRELEDDPVASPLVEPPCDLPVRSAHTGCPAEPTAQQDGPR